MPRAKDINEIPYNSAIQRNFNDKELIMDSPEKEDKEEKDMNKNNGNNLIKGNYEINQLYTLNNEKFITEQNQHIIPNEVESLPIKINLKNNKIEDNTYL